MHAPPVRKEVHYHGDVQGVGFRYSVYLISKSYEVSGFVENLRDGRVRLVVEGGREEVDDFLAGISVRLQSNIKDYKVDDSIPTGEFGTFDIRH